MEVTEYFSCSEKDKFLSQIETYEWSAAKFLAKLLKENRLKKDLGGWANVFLLIDGNRLVSFITLSAQDCIAEPTYTPWLGFFHTAPEYRGNRYGKLLIDYVCEVARNDGYKLVYLATDHIGLYEKYGFDYVENRIDIYGEDSRIYKKFL
ncbi:MAG: GNAT family N-acetyltransferase [Clostridia bacterium]|nr:GNAT family N-acetyltransferase [Clostridia bacterium]